jgi:hypothetical protein
MSVVGSFIGAFVVAYTNNRFQRDRDELRVLREKGELIISGLRTLSELYIEKYNYACACRARDGKKIVSDKFDIEMQTYNTMSPLENQIYALTQIYFPSCKSYLDAWQAKLGWADGVLRSVASDQYQGEYDHLARRSVDNHITPFSRSASLPILSRRR